MQLNFHHFQKNSFEFQMQTAKLVSKTEEFDLVFDGFQNACYSFTFIEKAVGYKIFHLQDASNCSRRFV